MKIHARSHNEVKEIHCPYCDEVFPQRYILYEHLVNDHEESSNLTCPICNKVQYQEPILSDIFVSLLISDLYSSGFVEIAYGSNARREWWTKLLRVRQELPFAGAT